MNSRFNFGFSEVVVAHKDIDFQKQLKPRPTNHKAVGQSKFYWLKLV